VRPKVLDLKIKKYNVKFENSFKKMLEIKKIFAAAQPSAPNTSLAAPKRAARN
jgi:hypothetical protein